MKQRDGIEVPVLVLTGEDPRDAFVTAAETMMTEIPDCRRDHIPDGGHAANIDNSEAFNERLREFLADIDTVSATPAAPQ